MRRAFSILFVILFALGPLAVALDGDNGSLPACCRRHGAHHCAMSVGMAAMVAQSDGMPILTAPSTCPYFPGYAVAPSTTFALAAPAASLPGLLVQPHTPAAARAAAHVSQLRTRAVRGPPGSSHS
jgi:hypothetical protein